MAEELFLDGADVDLSDLDDSSFKPIENKAAEVDKKTGQLAADVVDKMFADANAALKQDADKPMTLKLGRLFFDLETIPDETRLATFGLPELPPVPEAMKESDCPDPQQLAIGTVSDFEKMLFKQVWPAEWLDKVRVVEEQGKKRDGIFKAIDKAANVRQSVIEEHAARLKLLSTTPEYCRIASMAFAIDDGPIQTLVCPINTVAVKDGTKIGENAFTASEEKIVKTFWDVVAATHHLVGYNIIRFDLPVIWARSAILGVKATKPIDTRSWGTQVVDMYDKRFPKGASPNEPGKLKTLAGLYGLKPFADGVDGGDVYEMMRNGDYDEVAVYNASDVDLSRRLFHRLLGLFW